MTTWNTINGKTIDTHTRSNRAQIWDAYMGAQSVEEALANGVADDWDGYARFALRELARLDEREVTDEAVAELAKCLERYCDDECARIGFAATDEQLEALRDEAGVAGDSAMADLCNAALGGNSSARAACIKAIRSAEAMA